MREKITGKLTDEQWYIMDTIVKAFITKFPNQYNEFVKANKISNAQLDDQEFGSNKSGSMRWSASFPIAYIGEDEHSLLSVIEKHFPKFIKNDDIYYEFLRRYPEFKIANKI